MKDSTNFWVIVAFAVIVILAIFAFTHKTPAPIYQPPVPQPSTTQTFIDSSSTFSFVYPKEFSVVSSNFSSADSWMQNSTADGNLLAVLTIPRSYQPNTNFSEAKLTVGKSSKASAVKSCLQMTNGNGISKSTVNINGTTYTKFNYSDAGAGNFYDVTSYRTIRGAECYAVEYTIHSTNIGNYSPDQGITEFDKAKVQNTLETIVQSFKFL